MIAVDTYPATGAGADADAPTAEAAADDVAQATQTPAADAAEAQSPALPDEAGEGDGHASRSQRLRRLLTGGRARLVLPVLAVVVVGLAGALRPSGSEPVAAEAPAAEPVEVVTEVAEGPVVAVGEVTANLAGPEVHHARVAVAVVLGADVDPEEVGGRLPIITDAVVEELARRSYDELRTPEGSDALRDALTERAHELLGESTVVRVLLTGLLVQ